MLKRSKSFLLLSKKTFDKKVKFNIHTVQESSGIIAKKFILNKHFKGEPKPTDLKIVEEKLPPINDGEILLEAEYLSIDPYMRPYTMAYPTGITMIGSQVAKIIQSKNNDWPVGKRVLGYFGWRTHTILNTNNLKANDVTNDKPYIIPDFGDLSPSLALGVLGMPGNSAYFGFLEVCKPKKDETVVISGAAGAVGSHVGQIAKIKGLNAIGIAGSDEKCQWLIDELGFNNAINYKKGNIFKELKSAANKGIDCYFDNVGGDISSTVIYQMNHFGRVAVCGSISSYNNESTFATKTTILQPALVTKELRMEGFHIRRFSDRWQEGVNQNLTWIKEGKLKYKETVTHGFENTFDAFVGLLNGKNTGKMIVKV